MNNLKELQSCQLNILKEIDRICKKYDISYFLAYGTCLGAYRHKGFIPWDDDIDICMTARDLEKLKKHAGELSPPYFLQCQETDPEYGLMITRVRDSSTTLIEQTEIERDINHGVFIDIYPLCPSYPSTIRATGKIICSYIYRLLLYGHAPYHHGIIIKGVSNIFLAVTRLFGKDILKNYTYHAMLKKTRTGYVSIFYGGFEKVAYRKDWLFPTKNMPFEGIMMPVPGRVEKYLEKIYGDYMKLPPEDKRKVHHDYLCIDLENSYVRYKGIHYCKGATKR